MCGLLWWFKKIISFESIQNLRQNFRAPAINLYANAHIPAHPWPESYDFIRNDLTAGARSPRHVIARSNRTRQTFTGRLGAGSVQRRNPAEGRWRSTGRRRERFRKNRKIAAATRRWRVLVSLKVHRRGSQSADIFDVGANWLYLVFVPNNWNMSL